MKQKENNVSVAVIKSEDIDFQQYWFILKRRWLPGTFVFGTMLVLAAVASSLKKPGYQASGKILVKLDRTAFLTGVNPKENDKELSPLTQQGNPLKTEVEVILSNPLLKRTINELKLKDKKGELLTEEALKQQLAVKNIAGADVLEVSINDSKPQEAAAVVNKLMSLYIENNIITNRREAAAARKFIDKQLPETEAVVKQAELALRNFKERNDVVDLETESKSAVETNGGLATEIHRIQVGLANATARVQSLQSQIGMNSQQALAESSLSESSAVQEVLKQLQQVESQLALERTRLQEEHPTIISLKSKQAALNALLQERVQQNRLGGQGQVPDGGNQTGAPTIKQKLTENLAQVETERAGLASQLAPLYKIQSNYQQRIKMLPRLAQEQQDLKRRVEAAQATYETLLKNSQQTQVAENQSIGNARIIEPALVPRKPAGGNSSIMLALGGALGILLSGATVILLELRDKSVKNVKQAVDLFEYSLLAAIPSFGKSGKIISRTQDVENSYPKLIVRDTPRSPISEVYRMLQTNLEFLGVDKKLKVILVTSSVPKEGKSTVASNLAVAVAQLGSRVLLVDADMRHPVQHHVWNLTNQVGLSKVIVSQTEVSTVVKKVMPNLDVLTSGVMPPNPVALLKSEQMAALIESFSERYDFVIIDAPPLVVAADALVLGKMTDGVLLVARPGVVDSASATAAKASLEKSRLNVLGIVVNGVIPQNEPDSYFYYKEYHDEGDSTAWEEAMSESGKMLSATNRSRV